MIKNMNYLVSVIVPIYKVEKDLSDCVLSICNQTYRNLEIILVDDGSPDKCGQMCDEFARNDVRIKVIHKILAFQCTSYGILENFPHRFSHNSI